MYAAIDIGGTKTLLAVFDDAGTLGEQVKFPTPEIYEKFLDELGKAAAGLPTKDFRAAVVAAPGLLDRKHGVGLAFGNLPWTEVPLAGDIEKLLHCPTLIENDAKLGALSEARQLADKPHKVLYLTVSTGIGGGLITDGTIDPDFRDMEVGQILLEHDGQLQRWETFASGKAITTTYGKQASELDDPAAWQVIAHNLSLGILELVATLTPDLIIIGGGVGSHFAKFGDQLSQELQKYHNPLIHIPPITPAKRPEEAVLYGCFELAKDTYGTA